MSARDAQLAGWPLRMFARNQMFLIEWHKLRPLRNAPWTGTAVDDEIDRDFDYWNEIHTEWLKIKRGGPFRDDLVRLEIDSETGETMPWKSC